MARTIATADTRATLAEMAQVWLRLADEQEAFVPTSGAQESRPVVQQQQQIQPKDDDVRARPAATGKLSLNVPRSVESPRPGSGKLSTRYSPESSSGFCAAIFAPRMIRLAAVRSRRTRRQCWEPDSRPRVSKLARNWREEQMWLALAAITLAAVIGFNVLALAIQFER
jgi:hypothetical protein